MPFGLRDIWSITSKVVYNLGRRVGIGTTDPQYVLDVVGDIHANDIYEGNRRLDDKYVEQIGKEKFTDILISDIPQDKLLEGEDIEQFESNLAIRSRFDKDDFLNNSATSNIDKNIDTIGNMYKIGLYHHPNNSPLYGNHYIIGNASAYFNGIDTYYVLNNNDTIDGKLTRWDIIEDLTFTLWLRLNDNDISKKYTLFHFTSSNNNEYIWVYIENNYLKIDWKSSSEITIETAIST